MLSIISFQSFSQDDEIQAAESYCKANIAFTNFKLLGVSNNEFAKCVESINYLDASKTLSIAMIDDVVFADDGNNNDLIAKDGILTSTVLFKYTKGTPIVDIGAYRMIKNNRTIYDVAIMDTGMIDSQMKSLGFSISCKFVWVSCSAWPPQIQKICRQLSWPFTGGFNVTECTIGITYN